MYHDRTQECININKENIDIIGAALEEYWSLQYHGVHTIKQINDTRVLIRKIKGQTERLNEIKICWS